MFIEYSPEIIDRYIQAIDLLIKAYTNFNGCDILVSCPLCKVASNSIDYAITDIRYKLRGVHNCKFAYCESCPHFVFANPAKLESYLEYLVHNIADAEPICIWRIFVEYASMQGRLGFEWWESKSIQRATAIVRLNSWKDKLLEIKNEYVRK